MIKGINSTPFLEWSATRLSRITWCRPHVIRPRFFTYRKISNVRRTKSPKSNMSCLGLQLSLRNILKPGVSGEWRCSWCSADRRWSNYIWMINHLIAIKVRFILETWRYLRQNSNNSIMPLPLQWHQMSAVVSEITRHWTVCSTACPDWHQRKHQRALSLVL